MIKNKTYREALQKVIPEIVIRDGSILVTGASGLIGSCLIDLLMLANDQGRDFEIYALGRNAEKLRNRFSAFENSPRLHFLEQDVREPLDSSLRLDYIIHGASNADPHNYALYPAETMLINIVGSENVLEYCKCHVETKAIMLSTFEVYGNTEKDVYQETDYGAIDINLLRSCYPESKRCVELLTRSYVDEYKINAVIGRLCSIYGPTMTKDDSKAHAQFIRNVIHGENVILKSKGEQRRTYCYVVDAVTAILFGLERGDGGEVYNISYEGAVVSIAEVAQTLSDIAHVRVIYNQPDDIEKKGFSNPQNCVLDNNKLKSLGWVGNYDIKRGMSECVKILKSINNDKERKIKSPFTK